MKNTISLFLLLIFCSFHVATLAQENLKSSKILYDKGLDEIYDIQEYNGGYIAIGHKGDEATTKKLWLIRFDKNLNVIGSKIIYNQELVSPFRLQSLANGNVLVLAQDVSKKVQSAILFCLHPEGAISWSKRFSDKMNIELSDMLVTKDQFVYLYGAKKHILNQNPNQDKALLIKMDRRGVQHWQKEIAIGSVELRPKQIIMTEGNKLMLSGTLTDVSDVNISNAIVTEPTKIKKVKSMVSFDTDTLYIENPVDGSLEMQIVKRASDENLVQMKKMTELVNAKNGKIRSEIINDEYGNPTMYLFDAQEKTVKDSIYVEDAVTGELTLHIIERKVAKEKVRNANLVKTNLETDRKKTNAGISFYAIEVSLNGDVLNKTAVNRFADYSFSNAIVENEKGYLFLLQSANYFGDGLILQTDKKLNTMGKYTLSGAPMLFSGLFKQGDDYIVGGVFSNTLKDYSPGFVVLDKDMQVQQAKSSKSLFSHFFISNISSMANNSFMLSGIGYESNHPSDVYFLPFTSDGRSACELESYEMKTVRLENVESYNFNAQMSTMNTVVISDAQFALADENEFTSGNICTTPDENPVSNKENGSWNQWNNRNAEAFTLKIPSDWIKVSPNPSSGEFTVQYDGMQNENGLKVSVIDMNGRVVHHDFIQNQDVFKLDLRKLSPGAYHIHLHDGLKGQMEKVTIVE